MQFGRRPTRAYQYRRTSLAASSSSGVGAVAALMTVDRWEAAVACCCSRGSSTATSSESLIAPRQWTAPGWSFGAGSRSIF